MNNQIPWHEISPFFWGGNGSSPEQAVRINMLLLPNVDMRHMAGIQLEYAWIERHYPESKPTGQRLASGQGAFDCIQIQLPNGELREVYFEISTFFSQEPTPPELLGAQPDEVGPYAGIFKAAVIGLAILIAVVVISLVEKTPERPAYSSGLPHTGFNARKPDPESLNRAVELVAALASNNVAMPGVTVGPRIREDTRPLAGFYTNAPFRQTVHTRFARDFLPRYVHQSPHYFFSFLYWTPMTVETVEPTRFVQTRWGLMEMRAALIPRPTRSLSEAPVFRRVSDLTMSLHRIGGHPAALVQMPPPEHTNQSHFVAIVLLADADRPVSWPRSASARVFTLDVAPDGLNTIPPTGTVTEWTKEMRPQDHGLAIPAQTNDFVQAVAKLLQDPVGTGKM